MAYCKRSKEFQVSNLDAMMKLFEEMQSKGIKPSLSLWGVMFKGCADEANLATGKLLHEQFNKTEHEKDSMTSALIDMYAKCGSLEDAEALWDPNNFRRNPRMYFNVIIGAFGQYGHAKKSLKLFQKMQKQGVKPDSITVTLVLYACRYHKV